MKIMCVNNRIYSDSTIYSNGRHSYAHNNIKRAEPKLQQLQADTISFSGGFIPKSSLTTVGKRLFRNIEEFQSNLLEKLTKFQGKLPPELYSAVEKNISDGSFTIGEIVKAYYAGLKDCKSLAQVKKIYPEIPVTDYSPVKEIKKILRNSLPQDVCQKAKNFTTPEEQVNEIMSYFDNITSAQAKKWPAYNDIRKLQEEVSQEVANGDFLGNPAADTKICLFNNPQQPLTYNLINPEKREEVILDYLKQYYTEGKAVKDITPKTVNGTPMSPAAINIYYEIANKTTTAFRKFAINADKEVNLYRETTNMSRSEISSAVLSNAWTTSRLRADIAAMTQIGKGWSGMRMILYKMKYGENFIYPPERLIDKYLIFEYSSGRISNSGNPFKKYEDTENNTKIIINFINRRYNNPKLTMDEEAILNRSEFQAFRKKFNIEEMKKSFEIAEEYYKNVFFKSFWIDERKERFANALKQSYSNVSHNMETNEKVLNNAKHNIEVNDEVLNAAMSEAMTENKAFSSL